MPHKLAIRVCDQIIVSAHQTDEDSSSSEDDYKNTLQRGSKLKADQIISDATNPVEKVSFFLVDQDPCSKTFKSPSPAS